jgi:hypothetical protein
MASGSPKDFAFRLFSEEPQEPNSVNLYIDTEGDVCALFEVLLTIFTEGLKLWYKPPIVISNIKPEDFLRLQKYFNSFGYNINLEVSEMNQYVKINNKSYNNESELHKMKFQMVEGSVVFTVTFSKLQQ